MDMELYVMHIIIKTKHLMQKVIRLLFCITFPMDYVIWKIHLMVVGVDNTSNYVIMYGLTGSLRKNMIIQKDNGE